MTTDRSPGSVIDRITEIGIVPVVTIDRADLVVELGAALSAGGAPCAEITLRTDAGLPAIEQLRSSRPAMLVGAGTVIDAPQAERAVSAGADFVVSPGYDDEVVGWCLAHDVAVLPGVMTPTEMTRAVRAGLTAAKFFPAALAGGPAMLAAVGSVFAGLRFVPTGGVDGDNLASYLRLPNVVACGGSWMVDRRLLASGDVGRIEALTAQAVAIVRDVRAGAG